MKERPGPYLSFDTAAADYDRARWIPPSILDDVARLCSSAARLKSGGLFLDAGVGTGRFALPLSRLHPNRVIGIDISRPMMERARAKEDALESCTLLQADMQQLPFRSGAFQGALAVHVLQLIERWPLVLRELRRVLQPRTGVLVLGTETGGRSALVDFYYERARARRALPPNPGAAGLMQALAWLRRPEGGTAHVEAISAPYLLWKRRMTVGASLESLARRAYSQMWAIPDDVHDELMSEVTEYALRQLGDRQTEESVDARFLLYTVRWP